jgi:hypothetical protein
VKLILPISLGLLSLSSAHLPSTKTLKKPADLSTVNKIETKNPKIIYQSAGLNKAGLSEQAFNYAWKGYQHLLSKNKINRTQYLTVCDFTKSSSEKRLFIIDVNNGALLIQTYVAHGKNSGEAYATSFSNKPESLQSSLGFYVTANTYQGKHGLSLRLDGVDPGFNDKAMERTIVIHGASYVSKERAQAGTFMGRSWGCPAVPENESEKIISTIKNGTCLFIYHSSSKYLFGSKILND